MESFSERLIHLRHSNNLTRQQVSVVGYEEFIKYCGRLQEIV